MIRAREFLRARRGSTTVEFALVSLFFFGIMTVGLDFGLYVQQKLSLGNAVEQGAVLAFNMRDTIDPTQVGNLVAQSGGLANAPSVTCNNGAQCLPSASRTSSDYRCVNQATGGIDTASYTLGAACTGGGSAGYYLKIVATRTYTSMIVPDRWLGGTTMTQSAVVRLQ